MTLRPQQIPTPPPGANTLSEKELFKDGLPVRTGEVRMSDRIKNELKKLGWEEGDPIPGDFGVEVSRVRAEVQKELDSVNYDEMAKTHKPVQPKFVNIDDLPAEKQAELRVYLQEYKQQMAEEAATAKAQQEAEAQIPDNVQGAMREEAIKAWQIQQAAEQQQAVAATVQPEEPPPEHTHTADTGASNHTVAFCPRCNWDLRLSYTVTPTLADKRIFLGSLLSLKRFEKIYEVMGGNVRIWFRSLTSAELAEINNQLSYQIRNNEFAGDAEFLMWHFEYKMLLQLSKIEVKNLTVATVPEYSEWLKSNPKDPADKYPTQLLQLRKWFYEKVVPQDHMRRLVGTQQRIFETLFTTLTDLAENSDFWDGIEPAI